MTQLDLSLYFNHCLISLLLFLLLLIIMSTKFYNFFLIYKIRNNFVNNNKFSRNNLKQFFLIQNILQL